jgi:hypothetical protein
MKKRAKNFWLVAIILLVILVAFGLLFSFWKFGGVTGKVVDNEFNLVKTGFDPGLNIPRISSTFSPSDPLYFELCPNEPNQRCYGNIPAGGGFYTLSYDFKQCIPNTGGLYSESSSNPNVPCPYYFNWKNDGKTIANVKVDTLNFTSGTTSNVYLGIQTNIGGQVPYPGINFNNNSQAPRIQDIENVTFKFRAKLCYKPKEIDVYRYGRITYYVGWWNVEKQNFQSISIDLLQFWKPDNSKPAALVNYANTQAELMGLVPGDADYDTASNTIYVNGKAFGIVPSNYDFNYDNSASCSSSLDNAQWLSVNIPVQQIINTLISAGKIKTDILNNAKYSGEIIGGVEFWGRNLAELDVKDHTIWVREEVIQQPICTSFFYSDWTSCSSSGTQTRTITSQSPSGCTGGTPESLIQQCSPPCTISNWQYSDSSCLSSNTLTRTWTKIGNCNSSIAGSITKPSSETIACNYSAPVCTSFTYSGWSDCLSSSVRTRSVASSLPINCAGGNPVLSEGCNYTPLTIIDVSNSNNPCDITDASETTKCYANFAIENGNDSICEDLISVSVPGWVPLCYTNLAIEKKDRDICDLINNTLFPGDIEECYNAVSNGNIESWITPSNPSSQGENTSQNLTAKENKTSSTIPLSKEKPGAIKTFFIKLICRISNLFSSGKYNSCVENYLA